ncbi:type I-E CRISPR-associated protein Cse2/CasB (plasmid) [Deinococcus sp. KNUC1210]|uniref:type I-E CRISPR-associated protein Cse2/CasB n=1 Tax=Deinococcus sp. KNUC1210 TaxID=2917691 RepID=UPI001EF1168A|nr:type I-E CRISPR-associated protein Cse2/CasB [Deinococcus sp. KNUC1210]ULH13946.1 type I-E CRISPR-associated protein Cse2/CasB [Deinococcus sp. KNUC1210]
MTHPPVVTSPEHQFINRLARLARGQLADLRRSLSDDRPGDSTPFLEGLILRSGLQNRNRQGVYLTASLYALIERPRGGQADPPDDRQPVPHGPSLGFLLGTLYRDQQERPSVERRFLALLDADADALPYQLRQVVSLLKASGLKPDWVRLLRDVCGWDTRWGAQIRRQWANDFYRAGQAGSPPSAGLLDAGEAG